MRARFASNVLLTTLGSTLVALSLALSPGTLTWTALGVGCAGLLITAGAFLVRGRGATQRWIDLMSALLCGWTSVASRTFAGAALQRLTFAEAVALCAVGLAGLIAHQVIIERALAPVTA